MASQSGSIIPILHFSHQAPSMPVVFGLYLVSSICLVLLSLTVLEFQNAPSGTEQQMKARTRMLAMLLTYVVLLGIIVTMVLAK